MFGKLTSGRFEAQCHMFDARLSSLSGLNALKWLDLRSFAVRSMFVCGLNDELVLFATRHAFYIYFSF